MKILHIIREKGHELALSTAQTQSTTGSEQEVTILLIHDAVLTETSETKGLEVFALKDDVEARGTRVSYPLVDYNGMLKMIFESDRVITW